LPSCQRELFSAQDIPKLKRIVTYHVAFGDVRAEDLMQIEAETVESIVLVSPLTTALSE